jgi:hypothetical protein
MCLAQRYGVFNGFAPSTDVFKRYSAWIEVSEHRLDSLPSAPPIFARSIGLSRPFFSAAISLERFTQ